MAAAVLPWAFCTWQDSRPVGCGPNQEAFRPYVAQERFDSENISTSRSGRLASENAELASAVFRSAARVEGEWETFSMIYRPPRAVTVNGRLQLRFRLSGWEAIQYAAIGWMEQDRFWHVKISNPLQDVWIEEPVDPNSIAFLLGNLWEHPQSIRAQGVRVFVKGIPSRSGGRISLDRYAFLASCCQAGDFLFQVGESSCQFSRFDSWWPQAGLTGPNPSAIAALRDYERKAFPDYLQNARDMVSNGTLNMAGMPVFPWPNRDTVPAEVAQFTTARYLWHALNPSRLLLMAYEDEADERYLKLARELAERWLDQNYDRQSDDMRFAWYDHGTAQRLFVLLKLWQAGATGAFDAPFMSRLLEAIYRHAELLSSESFYARNQLTRYHNHAVFQDIALLAVREFVPQLVVSASWQQRAVKRLGWQFDHLVTEEGVSVENSFGYHKGMLDICQYVESFLTAAGIENWAQRCGKMEAYEEAVSYPDGRGPSYGDSYRKPNSDLYTLNADSWDPLKPRTFGFPQSGVAIVTDNLKGKTPWQLTFLAPSKTKIHKHEDNLELTFWMSGVEWLIDPGFYTHHYTEPMAAYSRKVMAHNGIAIPSRRYSIEPGTARIEVGEGERGGEGFALRGTHRCYEGLTISRSLGGSFGTGLIAVTDSLRGGISSGEEVYLNLQLGETVAADLEGARAYLSSPLSAAGLLIRFPAHTACRSLTGVHSEENIAGWSFTGFAEAVPITTLRCRIPNPRDFQWQLEVVEDPPPLHSGTR